MLAFLFLAACSPPNGDSAEVSGSVRFGSSEGACDGETIVIDVGTDRGVVTGDACPVGSGARCEPLALYRVEAGSSEWFASCDAGWVYSIAWVVPE